MKAAREQFGPMLAPGDEPPGRFVDNVWQGGGSSWCTRHGPAIVQWSLGHPMYVWNALLPGGARGDVELRAPASITFRRLIGELPEHGQIEMRDDDVTFTPLAELPKLDVKAEHSGLFRLLTGDGEFMQSIAESGVARALYRVLENGNFACGGQKYDFGQRSAAHFVAALRDNGEDYLDYAWSRAGVGTPDETAIVDAHFARLNIEPVPDQ